MDWYSIARSPAPLLIVARLNRLAGLRNCKAAIHRAPLSIGDQRRRCWFGQRAVSSFEYTQDVSRTKHANRPRKLVGGRKEPGDKGEIAAGVCSRAVGGKSAREVSEIWFERRPLLALRGLDDRGPRIKAAGGAV